MTEAQIVNKSGSPDQWTADVIQGSRFVARLSVFIDNPRGVQHVRLREEGTGNVIAEWQSSEGTMWGQDAISDMVEQAMRSKEA